MLRYFIALGVFFFSASIAQATCLSGATCSAATSYEITINQVEFCKSSACTDSVIVASTAEAFNIADSAAGAAVGNYADLDDVAAGVYTHVKTTIDGDISFLAPAAGSCAARTLTAAVNAATADVQTALALPANASFGLSVVGSDLVHTYELTRPLTISKAGSLPQVQIDFSTSAGHQCVSSVSYPGIPSVTIRVFDN